jgi:hypothetical protein
MCRSDEVVLTLQRIGRKFINLKLRSSNQEFRVHEDLICDTSKYVQRQIQRDRKKNKECGICQEGISGFDNSVDFCRQQCGQNFHEACISKWKYMNQPSRCPMCRTEWLDIEGDIDLEIFEALDPSAVGIYHDWLYTGVLQPPYNKATVLDENDPDFDSDNPHDDDDTLLLKAFVVGLVMNDSKFRHAVTAKYVETKCRADCVALSRRAITYAWDCKEHVDQVREYVVDACLASSRGLNGDLWYRLPNGFAFTLSMALMDFKGKQMDLKWFLRKHTNDTYKLVSESSTSNTAQSAVVPTPQALVSPEVGGRNDANGPSIVLE